MTPFRFLTRHARPSLARSGDARRAAHPSVRSDPGAGSSCLRRFARPRYRTDRATSRGLRRESEWRLTCTGLWTERRTCPRKWRRFLGVSAKSACAWRTLTTFPSSASRGHPLSSVRPPARDEPRTDEDGPTKTHALKTAREGCRLPVNQGAFHRCDGGHVKGSLLSVSRVGPLAHAAHTFPHGWGQVLWMGIASAAAGMSPRAA